MRSALSILIVCLFSACSSVNYVGIETYNPAEITFPKSVGKVLIVNNALPQPDKIGYEYKLLGRVQDTARAQADSALVDLCRSLGKEIADVNYFNDVLLYNEPTRKDNAYYSDLELTPQQVTDLCRETGTDAVISVDRLLFDMRKDVVAFADGYLGGDIAVKTNGVLRSYLPGRDRPLATVLLSDSLFWSEAADNMVIMEHVLPSPENTLRTVAYYIGSKVSTNFVPHWMNETRWYFKGMTSTWKEASAYAAAEKWEEASEIWKRLYEHSSGGGKAKAATNLALYDEMNSKLPEALDWATKAYDLFKQTSGENGRYTQLLQLYVSALQERIRSDKKLNLQFGKE